MRYGLEEKFRRAEAGEGTGFLRVSADHPVDLFIGIDEGRRALLLICEKEPPAAPIFDAIRAQCGKREDGRWAFLVRLERNDLRGLFAYLAENLILATERERDSHLAAVRLVERLRWWQRLLSKGRSGLLTDTELRGLVGELLFLRDCAIPEFGPKGAVDAWVGPFDAPRDFRLPDLDVEVKAVARDSATVRISSLEQLAPAGAPITLARIVLEAVSEESSEASSVQSIVNDVRTSCEGNMDAALALTQRLSAAGYQDMPEYDKVFFQSKPPVFYGCGEGFPALVPGGVPQGIVQGTYQIDIASIAKYVIPDWRQKT